MDGLVVAGKWAVELLANGFGRWQASRDPVRHQASRFLTLFEAHGVRRQQIARLLPARLQIPALAFSSPKALSEHITPSLLDWAASTFGVRRDWLDLVSEKPNEVVDVYKHPEAYVKWLEERSTFKSDRGGILHVVSEQEAQDPSQAHGGFFVVQEEFFGELGYTKLSRYHVLSVGWSFQHSPCLVNLLALMTIAEHFGISVVARLGATRMLQEAEEGNLLIPIGLQRCGRRWHIGNWVPLQYQVENCRTQGHRQRWHETIDLLESRGLERMLKVGARGRQ